MVSHGAGSQHDGRALGIQNHVSVQSHSVVEKPVEEASFSGGGQRLLCFSNAVQVGNQGVNQPHHVSPIHEVLIDQQFVSVAEGGIWPSHHQGIVFGLSPWATFYGFAKGIYRAIEFHVDHICSLR